MLLLVNWETNGKYESENREISRLAMQELSDFWRATVKDEVNIFGDFSPKEFAASLHRLKPGKAPVPDSICLELAIHAGSGLKFWLRCFLSSCLRQLKIPKSLERGAGCRDS